jgi:TatD DNase family protein
LDSIVSIGEIGLDYHWVKDPKLRDYQETAFIEFIELAKEVDKPLVIHSRKAEKEALDILESQGGVSKVLMHCFNGSVDLIDRIVKNRWLLSVPTAVVNRKNHQKIAQACPLDSMVIETDAPFLSPDKERRNEPSKVYYSAKKIAELKQIPISEVAEKTTRNAIDFYSLPI